MMRFNRRAITTSIIAVGIPGLALAGSLPESFTLGRFVPGDSWMYIHGVHNPENAWLEKEWADVFKALGESGVDRDVMELVHSFTPGDEEKTKTNEAIDRAVQMVKGVRWGDLVRREFVFAERMAKLPIAVEYAFLAHGAPGSGESNLAGLLAILNDVATLTDKMTIAASKREHIDVWLVSARDDDDHDSNMIAGLFRKDDVLGLVVGPTMLTDVLSLMGGGPIEASMMKAPRLSQALKEVPPPTDSIMFFDMRKALADMGGLCCAVAKRKSGDDASGQRASDWIEKTKGLVDVIDYIVASEVAEGRRMVTHEVTRIQQGKENSPLAKVFLDRKPFARFDEYIAADATGFNVSGCINLEQLYNTVVGYVRDMVPGGAEKIEQFNALLASVGFDLQRDVFSWWSGETMSVEMPAAAVTPMGGSDSVLMVRVKDSAVAAGKVNAAIDFVSAKLQSQGQMLMISPAQVDAEGFREVTHPMMAMFMRPVIGVHKDWLMIGTTASAVNRCLAVADGKAPSIRKNQRFASEGLVPTGSVRSASFKDTSNFGTELGAGVGFAGVIGGMMASGMEDEKKQVVQKVMGIVMKLGPVLQKLDFFSSESSVATYDGRLTVHSKCVCTYKSASSDGPKTADAR